MSILNITTQKKILRDKIKTIISIIPDSKRQNYDKALCKSFITFYKSTILIKATRPLTILTYMPLPDEPNITNLMLSAPFLSAEIVLPVSEINGELTLKRLTETVCTGRYNIKEPSSNSPIVNQEEIDLAIIPARALGKSGERLGRGKGYYDRFLEKCSCITIGLCYDEQIFDDIPMSAHDKCIDYVITPTTVYYNNKQLL